MLRRDVGRDDKWRARFLDQYGDPKVVEPFSSDVTGEVESARLMKSEAAATVDSDSITGPMTQKSCKPARLPIPESCHCSSLSVDLGKATLQISFLRSDLEAAIQRMEQLSQTYADLNEDIRATIRDAMANSVMQLERACLDQIQRQIHRPVVERIKEQPSSMRDPKDLCESMEKPVEIMDESKQMQESYDHWCSLEKRLLEIDRTIPFEHLNKHEPL